MWFKKDIRLKDHGPLSEGSQQPFLPIFICEPSVSHNYDFNMRHWRFIWQSLQDLKQQGLSVNIFYGETRDVFDYLLQQYKNMTVFSHQETGNDLTFDRDKMLKKFFRQNDIDWHEYQSNMVVRGLKNRNSWDAMWIQEAKKKQYTFKHLENCQVVGTQNFSIPKHILDLLMKQDDLMSIGGESVANSLLTTFLKHKVDNYWGCLSYPDKSRYFSSLLSPYLTYGNITIRQIYQKCDEAKPFIHSKKSLEQFQARLKWHCHFIQKFEMEPRIEFENLNPIFNQIRNSKDKKLIKAWKEGRTGFPLIDAAMRCVAATGYLNFRLRATVVSFLTHILWQPWQAGSGYLARMFLDYEPGIHFSQFQMQAGTTGINTIRIYNPIKQAKEKDKQATFIKRWVPELADLPAEFIHEPWKMTEMDALMYDFQLGVNYPRPIVDFNHAYKEAKQRLWEIKKSQESRFENRKILLKHVSQKRNFKRENHARRS